MKRAAWFLLTILALSSAWARAERNNIFGGAIDITAAVDDNPTVQGLSFSNFRETRYSPVYGIFPSLGLTSTGLNSEFHIGYAFGYNRVESDLKLESKSHNFSGAFYSRLSRNVELTVNESFTLSPDFTTFNLLRGDILAPEDSVVGPERVALRRNGFFNNSRMTVAVTLNPRSNLKVTLGNSMRKFQDDSSFPVGLTNFNQFEGGLHYGRTLDSRTEWFFGYDHRYFDFSEFNNARDQSADIGLRRQLSPTIALSLSAGPSFIESIGSEMKHWGYNASLRVSKQFENDLISLSYSRRNAATVGIGSLASMHSVGFDYSKPLGRSTTLDASLSLFDTKRQLDNPVAIRGLAASLVLNFFLSESWALNTGASYRNRQGETTFDLERRQVFVSLSYMFPNLWRF